MELHRKMLRALLDERFFNSCLVHEEHRKNEENSFCMDCCLSLCVHCMPHHQSHKILQIRRYMYNDVLLLRDAQRIFNCSLIQSYTTNNEKVVLMHPRQRQRISSSIRGSRCTCLVCNQNIKTSFVYCSMVCKLNNETASNGGQRAYAYSSRGIERSFLVYGSVSEGLVSAQSSVEENSTNHESMPIKQTISATTSSNGFSRKLHGRKCVPIRSPLF